MKNLLAWICLLMIPSWVEAQKGMELGGWIGSANYFGDLNTEYSLSMPGPALGLIYRYNFNSRLAFKFSANYGLVNADDARSDNVFENTRNLHFRSSILDGSAQFEFNFLPYIHGSQTEFITPYIFAGLSGFRFNPKAEFMGEWVALQPLGTEGQLPGEEYSQFSFGINYGFGLKFDINLDWSINVELSSRYLYTDYLDDVSQTYPDPSTLLSQRGSVAAALSDPSLTDPKIGVPGRQRGNSRDNDSYTFLSVGLLYYFGKVECPSISN